MACVPALAPFDADFGAAPPALFVRYARLYLRLVRLLSHAAAAVDEPVVVIALSMIQRRARARIGTCPDYARLLTRLVLVFGDVLQRADALPGLPAGDAPPLPQAWLYAWAVAPITVCPQTCCASFACELTEHAAALA
ncbi:hypothetical protein [Ralstonia mojiangensis]|jgi:hypothetical protein|uniref:Uncharacterized protein n=1 Tax=Ralstonia mojiangensis TaxID=2953895 RepID=A0AAE3I5R0_9RALS|nr:hypothetical protein [Ralstonia mojiangensis]MCO5414437.1 hypothetical protein [Ralstonia mojiangensis]MCT7318121.1 hypothetical protein [Ralstonia mojiangensis]MCT7327125.1 hypothetical protein [Ralstonia mojiangensis]